MWHNSSACHAYIMWAELGHRHFSAILNVVTIGNGTGTKNVLKWNRVFGFEFSIQSSVYGATTVAKVSLFSTWTRSTVRFYSMYASFNSEQNRHFSTQTNFQYLGLANVSVITGTCCS